MVGLFLQPSPGSLHSRESAAAQTLRAQPPDNNHQPDTGQIWPESDPGLAQITVWQRTLMKARVSRNECYDVNVADI